MKKHLVLISNEIAKDKGGIQNLCYQISTCLPQYYDLTIICTSDSEIGDEINAKVIKTKATSHEFKAFRLELILKLLMLQHTTKIDCVLAAQYSICIGCGLLKFFSKVPYVVLGHGNELLGAVGTNKIKKYLLNLQRKKILDYSNLIIANSKYTRDLAKAITNNKNIVVIHPPVEHSVLDSVEKIGEPFRLFSISRLIERKGIQLVLKALPAVLEKYPLVHYYVAGSGPYEQELRTLVAKLNISKNVTFLGKISEQEKENQYKKCALFLMPSFSIPEQHSVEGFGIVYLEANAIGKFVIGAKTGGVPDAIQDGVTGFLAEENSVKSVEQCILHFFSTEFKYSSTECRKWAFDHSVNKIVIKYKENIDNII